MTPSSLRRAARALALATLVLAPFAPRGALAQTAAGTPADSRDLREALGASGMTPEQIREKLREAGQSDADIDKYLMQAESAPRRVAPAPRTPPLPIDSVAAVTQPPAAGGGPEPFGFDMFHWAPTTFEPLAYGPVDPDYPLGPGDELALTLWGDTQLALSLVVSREGVVTLPDVGQVSVSGLTLEQARERIRSSLARAYSGLRAGNRRSTTFLSLSLGQLRTIQVFLLGQVTRPGSYTLSSVARVLYALYAAGGPTREGSLREVRVLRGGSIAAMVDVYDVILGGAARALPRLENGDVVFVPAAQRRITVQGPVRRGGIYELHDGEQLRALLRIAGGVRPGADLARAQIDRIVPPALRDSLPGQGRVAIDVPLQLVLADSTHDVAMLDGDTLTVFELPNRRGNTVQVTGRGVRRPGVYEFRAGMRVSDLVAAAGGVTTDAYLDRALLTRTMPDSSRMVLRFSPSGALAGQAGDNLALQALDDIAIGSQWDLKKRQPVSIFGLVHTPGTYELLEGMTLADLLMKAGGFTDDAFAVSAEIARMSSGVRLADTIEVPLQRDLTRSPRASTFVLEPHDAVFIRRDPDYVEQQFVTVQGEVRFPGTYALTRRDERVTDLIRRSGGLSELAYPRGARFLRAGGASLAIDLPRAIERLRASDNLVLQPGDTLTVPRFMPTVQVEGAVLAPVTALYQQGAGVGFYVTQANGFRPDADRGHVVVVGPNGRVRRGGQPEPGSRVVVPLRPPTESHDHIKDFATLMSIMASAATTYFLVRQGTK